MQEVFGIVKNHPEKRLSGAQRRSCLQRGFGVQGKGAASPFIPCFSLTKMDSLFLVRLVRFFVPCWSRTLPHRLAPHFDAMSIVNQAI